MNGMGDKKADACRQRADACHQFEMKHCKENVKRNIET